MTDPDVEQDAIAPQPPQENHGTAITTSESSETLSERASLLGLDNKQVGNYKSIEIAEAGQDAADENEGTVEVQKTPRAIAAVISVLLVGNSSLPMVSKMAHVSAPGVFIANADGSLVTTTYGVISSEFGAFGGASWLSTGYMLSVCAIQPLTGKLSDIFGRKEVILTSYVLFGIGCAIW